MHTVRWKFMNYKADAEEAYKEVTSLKEVTPENVVNLARNENSVIHDDFEWNDEVAGERYRIIQARQMIQNFVVETKNEEKAPVRVLQITTTKNVYKPMEFFIKNVDEYAELLNRAKNELQGIKKRYSTLTELEDVFAAIDEL